MDPLIISGKIPSVKEVLQISLNGIDSSFLASFSNLIGTEHGPVALESSKLLIISLISWGSVMEIKKEFGILEFR